MGTVSEGNNGVKHPEVRVSTCFYTRVLRLFKCVETKSFARRVAIAVA